MYHLSTDTFVSFIEAYSKRLVEMRDVLNNLDNRIGDGDHGTNMARGFTAAVHKLKSTPPPDVAVGCQLVAMTLLGSIGGASGPLYSTVFMKFMAEWKGLTEVNTAQLQQGLQAALEGLIARGQASVGDKTMIDVWASVVKEYAEFQPERDYSNLMVVVKEAVLATKDMIAKKGRAAYLGARSQGTCDPGSLSSALFFEELFAAVLSKGVERIQWHTLAL
jgi:phosphoenolpyruvate---glycerone phosphotransferase subunit DhaL